VNIAQMFLFASTCCLCAQEIQQRKNEKKIISQKCSSTKAIGIFTLARNRLGTAEGDILTLLHDFCDNLQTVAVRFSSKVL